MKRIYFMLGVLAITMCVALMAAQPDSARQPRRAPGRSRDEAPRRLAVRASVITGMNVFNTEGVALGSVYDIVIDARTGRVRYAALSYGGFLGFGETLVAVPWEALTIQELPGQAEYNLVLNATEEQIKGATGFDRDNWPDFADPELAESLDAHYGIERRRARSGVEVRVGPGGVDVDVEPPARRDNP